MQSHIKDSKNNISESEGTGINFSETEGTGISNGFKRPILFKVALLSCLFISHLAFANTLHLFSESEEMQIFNGIIHDKENNNIKQITGYFEQQNFIGLIESQKSSDDGSGDKSSDDGSGDKSSDDGSGGKSTDDGSGKTSFVAFNLNIKCNGQKNQATLGELDAHPVLNQIKTIYINGEIATCNQIFKIRELANNSY